MNTMDFPPNSHEIQNQLEMMLASPRFRNAPNPSAFLALVVGRKLRGKKTRGSIVAETLFKDKFVKLVTNDVRTTASNLRKALAKYYEREGKDDLVIISLSEPAKDPSVKAVEGEAYTPTFLYNPTLQNQGLIRFAYRMLEHATYSDLVRAHDIFSEILKEDPEDLGAGLGLVETLTRFDDRAWVFPPDPDPHATCKTLLDRMELRAGTYWRYWASRAFAASVFGDVSQSAPLFEKALKLDRIRTENYIPYIDFLFDIKRSDDGLKLANRYLNEQLEDGAAHVHFARFLAKAGYPDSVFKSLESALALDPGNRAAHELLAVLWFVKGDAGRAERHMQMLQVLCDPISFKVTVEFFQRYEEQYNLKGWGAKMLSAQSIVSSQSVEKS